MEHTVLVLGMGLQGKAVVEDLERWSAPVRIVVAEAAWERAAAHAARRGFRRTRVVPLDAADGEALRRLIREVRPGVVVNMLPPDFQPAVAAAALEEGTPYTSSSYTGAVAELDEEARRRGVPLLPEMGMDPGIDLLLGRLALEELDGVHGMRSYGAGLPEPGCARDNPIGYKISWTFEGVLKAYMRPARFLRDGIEGAIPAGHVLRPEHRHRLVVEGVGELDAYYNGDALRYIGLFGLGPELREMGRFAMRWPGHNDFWWVMAELGFLDETPETIAGAAISPRRFVVEHLTPRLQFRDDERDLVILRVEAWGTKDGRPRRVVHQLIDTRDLETGLFAMNRTVGFTTAIAARMILEGRIAGAGVLNPVRDVPAREVLRELEARGMRFERWIA